MLHLTRLLVAGVAACAVACSAGADPDGGGGAGAGAGNGSQGGGNLDCNSCFGGQHTPCNADGTPGTPVECPAACDPELGCTECNPNGTVCVGNEVHDCTDQGTIGDVVETCDTSSGLTCSDGACKTGCEVAVDQPSNVGCVFYAVDLDQQDGFNDPASAPWGLSLSNASNLTANVTIEMNEAAPGQPQQLVVVDQQSIPPGALWAVILPTRELDCGVMPNDYASPGTCLSSRAFRVTSSNPIIAYQFNVFENAYSNDASLLLPTSALGLNYRIIGWNAGHPVSLPGPFGNILDRSYITVVGTLPNTQVTVKPSWRIRGNPPVAATPAGGEIVVTINEFDVLNLETDDGTLQDDIATVADLTGSYVSADKPVAVFSGVESTGVGLPDNLTYPGWTDDLTCCLDHLEDQMFPAEAVGTKYVIPRSPVRSTSGWREPDVIRFVGVAEVANITTSLPAPDNAFTLQPGEVRTTYASNDFTATSDKPFTIGQLQVSNQYIDGPFIGDPSLTTFPPIDQMRTEYVILTPSSWTQNWVVIVQEVGSNVLLDGNPVTSCAKESSGTIDSVAYESVRCPLSDGVHQLTGDARFGVVAYGCGSAGSYAFVGGADVKRIYEPPPVE